MGETDPIALANHFVAGADSERAAQWLLAATYAARHAGTVNRARELAEQGLALSPVEDVRVRLSLSRALAVALGGDLVSALPELLETLPRIPTGSGEWYEGAAGAICGAMAVMKPELAIPIIGMVLADESPTLAISPVGSSHYLLCFGLSVAGQAEFRDQLLARVTAVGDRSTSADQNFWGWLALTRAICARTPGTAYVATREAVAIFRKTGDVFGLACAFATAGDLYVGVGDLEGALAASNEVLTLGANQGLGALRVYGVVNGARVMALQGRLDEATARVSEAGVVEDVYPQRRLKTDVIAEVHLRRGEIALAVRVAEEVLAAPDTPPVVVPAAHAVLARAAVHQGRFEDACDHATLSLAGDSIAGFHIHGSHASLARVRSLDALGRSGPAREALAEARARLLRYADDLPDVAERTRYLAIPVNAEILALTLEDRAE